MERYSLSVSYDDLQPFRENMNPPIIKAFVLCDEITDSPSGTGQKDIRGAGCRSFALWVLTPSSTVCGLSGDLGPKSDWKVPDCSHACRFRATIFLTRCCRAFRQSTSACALQHPVVRLCLSESRCLPHRTLVRWFMASGSADQSCRQRRSIKMDPAKKKIPEPSNSYTFELPFENDLDQDELNRIMRKPGDPPYDPTANGWTRLNLPQSSRTGAPYPNPPRHEPAESSEPTIETLPGRRSPFRRHPSRGLL